MNRFLVLLVVFIYACGSESDEPTLTPSGPLVNPFEWRMTNAENDPFAEARPQNVVCTEESFGPEDLAGVWVYSIDTRDCNWLTIQQPITTAVNVGDTVRANIWHFELTAAEPASALVGIATPNGIVSQLEEPIPHPARLIQLEFIVDTPLEVGTPLYFHVNNHGANSWHLVEILVNPPTLE